MEAKANVKEAKAKEGKAQEPAADDDLSMEEILQSIRRIIAEDDKDGKKDAGKANGAKAKSKDDEEVSGSDVLELTEMLKDDGSVVNVKDEAPAPEAKDVLNKINEALTSEKEAAAPVETKPEPKPEPASEVKAETPPEPPLDIDAIFGATPTPAPTSGDSLLSDKAAAASMAAIDKLKAVEEYVPPVPMTPAPSFRDGTTVEDLVTEMLRPMMKTWLDNNLPQLVERIVEREIRKLTK